MRIALTGGSGGIGSAITNAALARGYSVVSIDRVRSAQPIDHPDLRYIQAEATDYDALVSAFAECDAMIHMAAIPHPGTSPTTSFTTTTWSAATTPCALPSKTASCASARLRA